MRLLFLSVSLLSVVAAAPTGCAGKLSVSHQAQQVELPAGGATDYASLIDDLRTAGVSVEPDGTVDQPFFSVKGRMIKIGGEDVQVFQYSHAAAADAQAALVSTDGSAVGTSKLHWVGSPHFYKKGKLLVLYLGDDDKVLKALDAVLARQFAGK
ncbi:MAG: hypothetical protein M3Q00_05450 [Pseudomonadota bacterium]|nr:hypothetical protein [Pseudomonadota bacterium]